MTYYTHYTDLSFCTQMHAISRKVCGSANKLTTTQAMVNIIHDLEILEYPKKKFALNFWKQFHIESFQRDLERKRSFIIIE